MSRSRFVKIDKRTFEEGLQDIRLRLPKRSVGVGLGIREVQLRGVHEYVYEIDTAREDVSIRIYSSISKGSNVSRHKGADAIRCVIDYKGTEIFRGTAHTKRTVNWSQNLLSKIKEMLEELEVAPQCPRCNNIMTIRKGPRGKFWGCTNFPRCRQTKSY